MPRSKVNVDVRNGFLNEHVKLVAAVLIDPESGLPTAPGGGGGGSTTSIDFELLVIQDSNGVEGIRRETNKDGTITVEYTTLAGTPWVPVEPVTLVKPSLADNAATAANQSAINTAFGDKSDAAATSDTGAFSLIAMTKRMLTQLAALGSKLPPSLGAKTSAQSLTVTPATDSNVARETYGTVTILGVSTSTTGATFVPFGSQACSSLDVVNNSGADIEIRRGASGSTMVIRDGYSRLMQGIGNANQLQIRRADQANTAVSVSAEAYSI